jgi:hypothetical protein
MLAECVEPATHPSDDGGNDEVQRSKSPLNRTEGDGHRIINFECEEEKTEMKFIDFTDGGCTTNSAPSSITDSSLNMGEQGEQPSYLRSRRPAIAQEITILESMVTPAQGTPSYERVGDSIP